jgi:hypothetical protein
LGERWPANNNSNIKLIPLFKNAKKVNNIPFLKLGFDLI